MPQGGKWELKRGPRKEWVEVGSKQRRRRRGEAVLLQCLVRLCVFCVALGASVPVQHRSCSVVVGKLYFSPESLLLTLVRWRGMRRQGRSTHSLKIGSLAVCAVGGWCWLFVGVRGFHVSWSSVQLRLWRKEDSLNLHLLFEQAWRSAVPVSLEPCGTVIWDGDVGPAGVEGLWCSQRGGRWDRPVPQQAGREDLQEPRPTAVSALGATGSVKWNVCNVFWGRNVSFEFDHLFSTYISLKLFYELFLIVWISDCAPQVF